MSMTPGPTFDALQMAHAAIDKAIAEVQQLARIIARGEGGRETALCITKLQEASHWLEQVGE